MGRTGGLIGWEESVLPRAKASPQMGMGTSTWRAISGYGIYTPDDTYIGGALRVNGTATMGTLMHLTPGTAPASATEGDVYMDSMTHKLMVYDGTAWQACW